MEEQGPTPAKSVRAVVEIGPNYIFHLLAVAGVGFESGYAARYRHTVRHEDVALLRASAHLLTFAEGRAGELVEVAVFFPAYMNLAGEREIREYFDLLERGIAGDHGAFVERYRVHLEKWRLWPPAQVDKYFAGMGLLGPYGPALRSPAFRSRLTATRSSCARPSRTGRTPIPWATIATCSTPGRTSTG